MGVWSNHFQNEFHADDFHIIVNNPSIRTLANIPAFFTRPQMFSSEPEYADYKPLLLTSFSLDAALLKSSGPLVFQMDSFVWFALLILSLYLVFRLMPGSSHVVAVLATALFALHPIAAETVNYISQRGQIMGALGVSLALALWIVWPRRLPRRLGFDLNRVPQNWWQHQVRMHGARWEALYKSFLRVPVPFYLVPLIPALLTEPSAAVFVVLLLVYTAIYDRENGYGKLLPAAIVCGGYWLVQTAVSWTASPLFRISPFSYWITQPWVAMRYLYQFFMPAGLSADSDLRAFTAPWSPLAIAGLAGVAVLVIAAIRLSGRKEWRGAAFGICWFLIGLAPSALVPQRNVEATPRMFFAAAGLAFAVASIAGILFERLDATSMNSTRRIVGLSVFAVLAAAVLGGLSWMTYERNAVWESEPSLWLDVIDKSPKNGRAYVNYAAAMAALDENQKSLEYLQQAIPLCADDGVLQLRLAQGFDHLNRDPEAEAHFRRALAMVPGYSPAYAYFGRWLLTHQRVSEAFEMSSKALALNSADLIARHTLLDIYSQRSNWGMVTKLANETLAIQPNDPEAARSLVVSQSSIDQLRQAEAVVKTSPTVDDYLKLSVLYYRSERYEDCIKAAREALRLRPELGEAYSNIASAEHALGRDDNAIAALREVVRLRPDMTFAKTDLDILLAKKAGRASN